jgi:LysM repeat protein
LISIAIAAVVTGSAVAEAGAPARMVLYELRDGDTLSGIAARFHLPVKDIAELNHLKNANLLRGAGLLLPEVGSTRSLPRWIP